MQHYTKITIWIVVGCMITVGLLFAMMISELTRVS